MSVVNADRNSLINVRDLHPLKKRKPGLGRIARNLGNHLRGPHFATPAFEYGVLDILIHARDEEMKIGRAKLGGRAGEEGRLLAVRTKAQGHLAKELIKGASLELTNIASVCFLVADKAIVICGEIHELEKRDKE